MRSALLVTASVVLVGSAACGACGGDSSESVPSSSTTNGDASTPDAPTSSQNNDNDAGDGTNPPGACGSDGVSPGYSSQSLVLGSETRTYGVVVPSTYDRKTAFPIVLSFHGDGGNGQSMRGAGLEEQANGKAIFVYPDGPNQTWDLETPPADNKDYQFFDALLSELSKKYCVDTKKVFLFGFSRGGFFVNQLGCFRASSVRALVAHSGGGPYSNDGNDFDARGWFKACNAPPPAAMIIHGQSDTVVKAQAGQTSADHWRIANECQTSTNPCAPSPCASYAGCPSDKPVVYCSIGGLDHALWDSAAKAAWGFFDSL
ncbi:hypothetical protein AKJ09_07712 [Labilithrix luteola]|uniref:Uncharacterized protein n=1 Tax=Labilithrix luteola TaxID=1391654 RepID=A0A0K1Q5P3_9BACT|nr:hypothetical protein [Labilithrix luteola]AKV01049.1 hypothetical protein AKJ09_07712 [Labilithrix luteola]